MAESLFWILPILSFLVLLASTITTYVYPRVTSPDPLPRLPYPTDLGDTQPMLGVKMIGVGLSSMLEFSVMLIRYLQVKNFYPQLCVETNIISFVVGIFMIVGECVVAVFSLNQHLTAHYSGLALYVGSGCIFMIVHAHVSRKNPFNHPKSLIRFRIVLSVLGCVFPTLYVLSRLLRFEEKFLVPQIASWAMQVLIHVYVASFMWDLGRVRIKVDSLDLDVDNKHMQSESSLMKENLTQNEVREPGDENETIT